MKKILFILFWPFALSYLLTKQIMKLIGLYKISKIEGRRFRIYIAGVPYKNDDGSDRQKYVKKCKTGEELVLVKTPSKYDEYGIQIYRRNGQCLGWVPAKFSYEFTTEMERDITIRALFHSRIKPNKNSGYYGGRVTIVKQT